MGFVRNHLHPHSGSEQDNPSSNFTATNQTECSVFQLKASSPLPTFVLQPVIAEGYGTDQGKDQPKGQFGHPTCIRAFRPANPGSDQLLDAIGELLVVEEPAVVDQAGQRTRAMNPDALLFKKRGKAKG